VIDELESAAALYEEMKKEFPVVLCHLDSRIENIIYNLNDGMYFEGVIFKVLTNAED
jgi:thiamine kinase-like enzyme